MRSGKLSFIAFLLLATSCGSRSNNGTNADSYSTNDSSAMHNQSTDTAGNTPGSPKANVITPDSGTSANGPDYKDKANAVSAKNQTEQTKVPVKVGNQ